MKKILLKLGMLSLLVFALGACQQEDADSYQAKKEELNEYRNELVDLRQKVKKLENEIRAMEEERGIRESKKSVKTRQVAPQIFKHSIDLQGLVESDENVNLSSEVAGTVTQVLVDVGDQVQRGDVIMTLDDQALRNQLAELQTNYELHKETYQKQKNLWDRKIGSEMQYLTAKNRKESLENQIATLKTRLSKYTITAPISGIVDDVVVNQGEMVSPGVPLAKIVDASEVKVVADVSERYVNKIRKGDSVKVSFPAIEKSINTVIHATGQVINRENRTFKVVVKLDNHDRMLKPNLLSKLNIYDFVKEDAIVIPTRLVHYQSDSAYVYTAQINNGDTLAQRNGVSLSFSNAEHSLVQSGLAAGEHMIVEGHDRVSHGEKIRIVR